MPSFRPLLRCKPTSTLAASILYSRPIISHTTILFLASQNDHLNDFRQSKSPFHLSRMMSTNPTSSSFKQPSDTAQVQSQDSNSPSFSSLGIRNSAINEEQGVNLSDKQKVIVGSVLDLFEGNPTLKHFSLWNPEAIFEDPITKAAGESKYKAQWYGLPALFHPIKLQSHKVIDSGNPIRLEMSNKYVVRGIGKEQVMNSVVDIFVDDQTGRIDKVLDKWNGKLPENVIADTFRKLNAVTVPMFVTVPKTEEEDMKMQAARAKEEKDETK